MNYNKIILLFIVFILGLTGCQEKKFSRSDDLSRTAIVAIDYLEQQGYEVLSYEQHQDNYKLTESKIGDMPYSIYWELPGNAPSPYIGKTVDVEKFIVKNHPLDQWKNSDGGKSKGKTYTYVYVVENKVVGGTSFPYGIDDAGIIGGYWSLDGRSGE